MGCNGFWIREVFMRFICQYRILFQDITDSSAGEFFIPLVCKQRILELVGHIQVIFGKVALEKLNCMFHQWHHTDFASLSQQSYLGWSLQPYGGNCQVSQLLDTGAGIVQEAKERKITPSAAGVSVRLRQEDFNIVSVEITNGGDSFFRNGMDRICWAWSSTSG